LSAARALRLTVTALAVASVTLATTAAEATVPPSARRPAPESAHHRVHREARWKKGVATWAFRGTGRALRKSGVSWYYTWSVRHRGIAAEPGVQFVPMIWGPASVTTRQLRQARREGNTLLGFNEPDLAAQSDLTVRKALRLWPRLMATGMRLGSPAVAGGAATPGGWLDQFMAGARARHYRVSFITLHWYGQDFATGAAVSELKGYLQQVWNYYHKPIWLTEFALWRFNPSTFPSPRQQAAFVKAATAMLQRLPYVWRYAWFALPTGHRDGTTGLFRPGAKATVTGHAFEQVDQGS
jgi:putative glycosyl hydrolase